MAEQTEFTLTTLAYYGRTAVKVGGFLLLFLMVGRVFASAALRYWQATHPPELPPPTARFGALPPLAFPVRTADQKPTSYQLETATGKLPTLPKRAKVFLMSRSAPSLLADQAAKQTAAQLGFDGQPILLTERAYRWTKNQPLASTLELDIQNKTFSITSNFLSKPELFSKDKLPSDDDAVDRVRSAVTAGVALHPDIATPSGVTQLLRAAGSGLTNALSFSDADFVQVDLYRAPIDGLEMYTPDGISGTIHGIVFGGLQGRDGVVELSNRYHPVQYDEADDYPLRTLQSAWQILQAGEGYVAHKGTANEAVIRDIYLGYYDDFEEQDYLQPIYVFLGDGGFVGYIPAVDPAYVQQ